MKLIGKYSAASALRWFLGFVNFFVMFATCFAAFALLLSLFVPDFFAGLIDGMKDGAPEGAVQPDRSLYIAERMMVVGAVAACGLTWWVINRLRAILLAVNRGDAFERANVNRLRAIGFGLLGIQLAAIMLAFVAPMSIGQASTDYDLSLGSWLGILVVFILAEVFRQGSAMRDEQLTTV
jgi:hypothetical protein